jgi:DNA repair exonuclease SbcCD nuclease subunit/predicted ATPase
MSFICTADLQAEWGNLDLCDKAWDEVLHNCKKYKLKTIVFAGDGKEVYDPVSIRVIKWWQRAIRKARKLEITVIYLRGNHDRISTYSESGDWLSILRRAGATTFSRPGVVNNGDRRLFFLPFANVKQSKEWAKWLLKFKPDRRRDVLFFHCNLLEARYSQHGKHSDSSITRDTLCADRYKYCIGGDIHFPQKLHNTYYVGSPFCQDWGEVNQRKRYLVVRGTSIVSVHSKIARWFDPDLPGFRRSRPSNFEGTRVRIQVRCSTDENYERRLRKVRRESKKQYPGAELFIIPKFIDNARDRVEITKDARDETKIREYIHNNSSHRPDGRLVKYMLEKLSHFSHGLRTGSKFKFKWVKAKNCLSFELVKFNFRQKGIIVVRGVNHDRGNKSNGSGKTSLINLIPVAWFGKTFKGQAHDKWSNRFHPKDNAYVHVCGEVKHKEIRVLRGRRPTALSLYVNGHNESTGNRPEKGTQEQVEQVTGFTWDTLANAVYIDRTICDAFLSGTKAQRTEVLSRFQNLERFDKALKLVRKDIKDNSDEHQETREKLGRVRGRIEECKHSLHELKEVQKQHVQAAYEAYRGAKSRYHKYLKTSKRRRISKKARRVAKEYEKALASQTKLEKQVVKLEEVSDAAQKWVIKWHNLRHKEYCPTCYQDLSKKTMHVHTETAEHASKNAGYKLAVAEKMLIAIRRVTQLLEGEHDELQSKITHIDKEASHLQLSVQYANKQHRELSSSHHNAYAIIGRTSDKLKQLTRRKSRLKSHKEKLFSRSRMYEYVAQAFSRDGIPAFLNRQLLPVLNNASEYYADLFSDKEVQVRFKVEGGEFVPQVINSKGGERINDQSTGERALAGLVASFALRECAPECNLLILDEPGEGLDSQTAKQFARSLKTLNKKFSLIIVTTHNENILSALEGEQVITVHKKDGISRVEVA